MPAAPAAVFGSNWSSTASAATVPISTIVMSERKTEPRRRPVSTLAMGRPVLLDTAASVSMWPARRTSRSSAACASARYASLPSVAPDPARRMRNSETPSRRASKGRTMSTAWMRASGRRRESFRMRPVSIRSVSPSKRQRVTIQWM